MDTVEEIDIEEHDIMDNPTIKRMFPDLSVLKKEIDRNRENALESTTFIKSTESLFQEMEPDQQAEQLEYDISNSLCTEEIIDIDSLDDTVELENNLQYNKIILGSKPNKVPIDGNYFDICVKPYQVDVVLHDIKSYLQMSNRYCAICGILFPELSSYESHVFVYHPQTYITDSAQRKPAVKRTYKHKCNICTKIFSSSSLLKKHVEIDHSSCTVLLTNTVIPNNNETLNQKEIENICEKQKKIENNNSDLSNTCYHCKETFETQKSLIDHLYDILKPKRTRTEIVPVLKSVLFRCDKCDIHFVSSELAANHQDHMEMLINWKCSICYRIFKKKDELSHERQHSVSNNFLIYNLSDLNHKKILFKCSKCTGHFTESKFLYHFRDCGLKTNKLAFCNICQMYVDSSFKFLHESEHLTTDMGKNQYTVIETEVISDNPVKPALKGYHVKKSLNNTVDSIREVKVVLQRVDTDLLFSQIRSGIQINSQSERGIEYENAKSLTASKSDQIHLQNINNDNYRIPKNKAKLVKPKLKGFHEEISNIDKSKQQTTQNGATFDCRTLNKAYMYCEECTCFIPKRGNVKHVQSRCTNLKKKLCKTCGLMLTLTSFRTHKRLHERHSDLKLTDLKFFSLYNGKRIVPPIPKYPNCKICGVHFVSETAMNNHVCSDEAYLTCHICEMKLTEAAFKLHVMFHKYSIKPNNRTNIRNKKSANSVQSERDVHNTLTKPKHVENGIKLQKPRYNISDSPLQSNTLYDFETIYTCRNCNVTVDTYDKVVEHCHGHYYAEEKDIDTEMCNICSLKIDKACYTEHQNLHEKSCSFKILRFDSYYFPVENDLWIKHVFKSIPKERVLDILKKSIYRFEGRIRMEITQQGCHDLTVYKCEQCRCFIEPAALFKHGDNSCFKLRKHPCTICGLPFISSASRMDHEKIHKRPGINLKSYRIVAFNREQDKELNNSICFRKRYILYQCRNCDGIIDKRLSDDHQCNVNDLKTCPDCNLLLNSKEFEFHAAEHKEFASFNYSNMKVILHGEVKIDDTLGKKTIKSNYQGVIFDYKMYKCSKCQICIRSEKHIPKHSCYFGKPHSKCPKCDLYFSVSRLKTHLRSHERDPDFLRKNMTIIAFDPHSWDYNKNATIQVAVGDNELSDSNDDSDSDIVFRAEEKSNNYSLESSLDTKEIMEETVKVYRCACGLHFLNEDSIFRHFGVCRSNAKVSKQKCPKCDLLFTSNILFTHLLAHHSNKNRRYKYEIIETVS